MGTHNLPKRNRLTNQKQIRMLFQEGRTLKIYPCTVFYLLKKKELSLCNKVLFAVSKRILPSAIRRNRVKRLLREAYRTNKHILDDFIDITGSKFVFLIGYVYTGKKEKIHYSIFNKAIVKSLYYFSTLLKKNLPE